MDDKKNQLIEYLQKLTSNPNISRISNISNAIIRLVAFLVALIAMISGFVRMARDYSDTPTFMVFKIIFIVALVADVAFLLKEILQIFYGMNLSKMNFGSFDKEEYDDLVKLEKVLRKSSLLCDLITELAKSGIGIVIGVLFIVGGIYMGITRQGESLLTDILIAVVFSLMGITAVVFFATPIISIVKELFRSDSIDWEEYDALQLAKAEKVEKRFKVHDIKLVLFGSVFFFCGLLAFFEGFSFIPKGDVGQTVGMCILGLIFMIVGSAIAYFLGVMGFGSSNEN